LYLVLRFQDNGSKGNSPVPDGLKMFGLCARLVLAVLRIAAPEMAFAAQAPGIEGRWLAQRTDPGAAPRDAVIAFTRNGSAIVGTMRAGGEEMPLFDVQDASGNVSFTLVIPGTPYVSLRFSGTRSATTMSLESMDESNGIYRLSAQRADPAPAPVAVAEAPSAPPAPTAPEIAPAPIAETETPPAPSAPTTPEIAPPPAPEIPAFAPFSGFGADALIPALREPEPMPEVASVAPPEPPATRQRYTPPPLSADAATKLPLPPLRDVPPGTGLKTPPMGWATRQRLGTLIDDEAIRQAADGLEETGLKAAGYSYVEVDDGWQGARDANGVLHSNPEFPDMKALGDYIHGKGLMFGLMTAAAPQSCAGYTGSYGHEVDDAKTFASWGVDVLVYDWCGAEKIYSTQAEMQAAVQRMGESLRASGRDIALEIGGEGRFDVASWGAKTGAAIWRTAKDIEDTWSSAMDAGFAVAGTQPGNGQPGWNDPGLLQTGNGGMTAIEYGSQINLWAVLGAPMVLGNDVRIMRRETVDLLTNREAIAINQDALGRRGVRVSRQGNAGVWTKQLSNGAVAVLFINRGDASAPASVSWEQLGITGPKQVRDVWWHEDIGMANNRYAVFLAAHTSLLLVLRP